MSGFLSCPACGASNIPLGAPGCPGCRVAFAAPVVNPQFEPAMSAVATAPAPPRATLAPQPTHLADSSEAVTYASIWRRAGAGLVDWAIFDIPVIAMYGWSEYWNADAPLLPDSPIAWAWMLVWLAYVAIMQSSSWQATLGMRAFGLRIQRENDFSTISPWRAVGRDLLTYLSAFLLMIGFLMIAFTQKRQALHDKFAGTVVVRDLS